MNSARASHVARLVWFCGVLSALSAAGICQGQGAKFPPDYRPVPPTYLPLGPAESASFEMALFDRTAAIGVCGIWPRPEILDRAEIPGQQCQQYIVLLETWLGRILKEDIQPADWDSNKWRMVPELRWDADFLLGRFTSQNKKIRGYVEFQATTKNVTLAINSDELFATVDLDDARIQTALCAILNIPQEHLKDLRVEKRSELLGDEKIPVCHGKMYCNWTQFKDPMKFEQKWWSAIPFWMTKGKLCVTVSTTNWKRYKRYPPAVEVKSRMRSEPELAH